MFKNIVTAIVVALVTSSLVFFIFMGMQSDSPETPVLEDLGSIQGTIMESPYVFKNGSGDGGVYLSFTKDGTIGSGSNQGSWRNTTGRSVFVDYASVGFTSGTASSSMTIYAATSTSSTLASDFARPGGLYALIDGANFATSTPATRIFTSTSTPDGNSSSLYVADGEYLVFQVQETYGCVSVGACETATSTNRGITSFDWFLRGHYKP